jgi:6-phosphogluconolactonase (cycloisomerase 2 family)
MRVVALGLALAVLAARPADAGTMLYTTAASSNHVYGYCLDRNGALPPQPAVTIEVATSQLRRLLVRTNVVDGVEYRTLYVAGIDRVEAYRIGPAGGLTRISSTDILPGMSPRDLALSPDGNLLYVPQRNIGRLVGYALAPDGTFLIPPDPALPPFVTCVQGIIGVGFHSLFVDPTLRDTPTTTTTTPTPTTTSTTTTPSTTTTTTTLPPHALVYVSGVGLGLIQVFAIDAAGMFLETSAVENEDGTTTVSLTGVRVLPAQCQPARPGVPRTDETEPLSYRNRLARPKTVLIEDGMLYVEERSRRQITAFELMPDGNFAAPTPAGKKGRKLKPQPISSRTQQVVGYENLVFDTSRQTLIGAGFVRGRIDSYRLGEDRNVRRQPTRTSQQDLRMTPVRMTVGGRVLYVAAGQRNRIVAYRLREDGVLADTQPFSTTENQEDSFPNDVALATIPGCN